VAKVFEKGCATVFVRHFAGEAPDGAGVVRNGDKGGRAMAAWVTWGGRPGLTEAGVAVIRGGDERQWRREAHW